jgi:hypothetical protein
MSTEARTSIKNKTRPRARLGRTLEKNLLAYAAAASAGLLLGARPADAEIIYTPSNIPISFAQRNLGPAFTRFDLSKGSGPDFTFAMSYTSLYSSATIRHKFYLKIVPAQAGNGAIQGAGKSVAAALSQGEKIGPQQKFGSDGLYMVISEFDGFGSRKSGTWQNVEFAYVGLKFVITGEIHYGWARIKFPYPGTFFDPGALGYPSIYGYAYESTPNQAIVAGQTSGSAQETSAASTPASLGALAAGASGVNLWRGRNFANDVRLSPLPQN